jgi:hypothetical protein
MKVKNLDSSGNVVFYFYPDFVEGKSARGRIHTPSGVRRKLFLANFCFPKENRKERLRLHQKISGILNNLKILYENEVVFRTYKHCLRRANKSPLYHTEDLLSMIIKGKPFDHTNSPWHRLVVLLDEFERMEKLEAYFQKLQKRKSLERISVSVAIPNSVNLGVQTVDEFEKLRLYHSPGNHGFKLREPGGGSVFNEKWSRLKAREELSEILSSLDTSKGDSSQLVVVKEGPTAYDFRTVSLDGPTFVKGNKSYHKNADGDIVEVPRLTLEEHRELDPKGVRRIPP